MGSETGNIKYFGHWGKRLVIPLVHLSKTAASFSDSNAFSTLFLYWILSYKFHFWTCSLPALFKAEAAFTFSSCNRAFQAQHRYYWLKPEMLYFILRYFFEIDSHLFHVCHSCLQFSKCSSHFVCLKEFLLGAQSLEAFRMLAEVSIIE